MLLRRVCLAQAQAARCSSGPFWRATAAREHCRIQALQKCLRGNLRCFGLKSHRVFSTDVQARGTAPGSGIAPLDGRAGSLAELSDRAGFLPKPEAFDERLKPGFRGGRALFIFFLCNAMPFSALLYYLSEQRSQKAQLSLLALPSSADDVASEVLRVIRTSAASFLLQDAEAVGSSFGGALRVDPHAPETNAYVPPKEPLPLLPQMERNVVTDLFEAPAVGGLGFVHFALSKSSIEGAAVQAGRRRAGLLYMSHTRGAYCTVSGQLSVLSDEDSKRRYWKSIWSSSFAPPSVPASQPSATPGSVAQEPPPPWRSDDYLLIRLAVDEASLQAIVDGPQRWDARRVRRLRGASTVEGSPNWDFVVPGGAS